MVRPAGGFTLSTVVGGAITAVIAVLISAPVAVAPVAEAAVSPVHPPLAAGPSRQLRTQVTAFSWLDNDPPNSGSIGDPVLHRTAGGQGTEADPITVSVSPAASFRPGTRFYLPSLQRYLIAEDSSTDPTAPGTDVHLTVWIDGRGGTPAAVQACEDAVTDTGTSVAEVNPAPGRPVTPGPIFAAGGCRIPPES